MARIYKKVKEEYLRKSKYARARARKQRKAGLITERKYNSIMNKALTKSELERSIKEGTSNNTIKQATKMLNREVRGLRKKRLEEELKDIIQSLNNHGYNNIDRNNVISFIDMMEQLREAGISSQYGSDYMADRLDDLFGDKDISNKDVEEVFNKWLKGSAIPSDFERYMPVDNSGSYDL